LFQKKKKKMTQLDTHHVLKQKRALHKKDFISFHSDIADRRLDQFHFEYDVKQRWCSWENNQMHSRDMQNLHWIGTDRNTSIFAPANSDSSESKTEIGSHSRKYSTEQIRIWFFFWWYIVINDVNFFRPGKKGTNSSCGTFATDRNKFRLVDRTARSLRSYTFLFFLSLASFRFLFFLSHSFPSRSLSLNTIRLSNRSNDIWVFPFSKTTNNNSYNYDECNKFSHRRDILSLKKKNLIFRK